MAVMLRGVGLQAVGGVPIPLKQSADPHWLLTAWQGDGWSVARQQVLRPAPANPDGSIDSHVQLDAFEWVDITAFGIGNLNAAIADFDREIAARGSSLFAYAIFQRDDFNALGIRVRSYRLVLLHSQAQLLLWAVAIIAAAFAVVIVIQYITTGHAPALTDLANLWGSAVASVGTAAGNVGSQIAGVYIAATIASGVVLLLIARAGKEAGVKTAAPRGPSGSLSLKAGPATVRAGT